MYFGPISSIKHGGNSYSSGARRASFFKVKRGIRRMLGRPPANSTRSRSHVLRVQLLPARDWFSSAGPIETHILQGRSNEAEITLIRKFRSPQISISCILGLSETGIFCSLVFIVGQYLIYDEIVYFSYRRSLRSPNLHS